MRLAQDWKTDDNYSHGFLIIPLAAYFAYERRTRLGSLDSSSATRFWGALVIAGSLALLTAGTPRIGILSDARFAFVGRARGHRLCFFGGSTTCECSRFRSPSCC